jgi:hypothetical protein
MTHIAIQEKLDGKPVDWLEHMTAEQYDGRSSVGESARGHATGDFPDGPIREAVGNRAGTSAGEQGREPAAANEAPAISAMPRAARNDMNC